MTVTVTRKAALVAASTLYLDWVDRLHHGAGTVRDPLGVYMSAVEHLTGRTADPSTALSAEPPSVTRLGL